MLIYQRVIIIEHHKWIENWSEQKSDEQGKAKTRELADGRNLFSQVCYNMFINVVSIRLSILYIVYFFLSKIQM